jgi:hypothetical protein
MLFKTDKVGMNTLVLISKESGLTISVQCYKRVENGKDRVPLHLNECLHLYIGKDPMLACVSIQIYEEKATHAAHISITLSGSSTGMRVTAWIPLRAGIIVSVSSSLDTKNATRTLTKSCIISARGNTGHIARTRLLIEILQWTFSDYQSQKLHT